MWLFFKIIKSKAANVQMKSALEKCVNYLAAKMSCHGSRR